MLSLEFFSSSFIFPKMQIRQKSRFFSLRKPPLVMKNKVLFKFSSTIIQKVRRKLSIYEWIAYSYDTNLEQYIIRKLYVTIRLLFNLLLCYLLLYYPSTGIIKTMIYYIKCSSQYKCCAYYTSKCFKYRLSEMPFAQKKLN